MSQQEASNNELVLDFNNKKKMLVKHLKQLPPTELHYYFALLLASIENDKKPEQYTYLINDALEAVQSLNQFYADVTNESKADLLAVMNAINTLIAHSKMHSASQQVKKALLALCSVVLGLTIGALGAGLGFMGGLISDYTIIGNLRAAGFGFLTGLVIGAFIGSRCPDLVFQSALERKVEFCIKHIDKIAKELALKKTHSEYATETKQYIMDVFFKEIPENKKEAAFASFLKSTTEQFQVSTIMAGFVSPALRGHLGHHNLIAYSINGVTHTPLEYGDRYKTPRFFAQNESPRVITGNKLFQMLILDRILQETYSYSLKGVFKDYDLGSNDCRTYVDKLLIGTGQPPTKMPRFNPGIDKPTGTYIIGPVVRFFSKTKETELASFIPRYKKDPQEPDPIITAQKWSKNN